MKNINKQVLATVATVLAANSAFAQEAAHTVAAAGGMSDKGVLAVAAGLAIGLAAVGGAIGQARTAASALEGIARNPASQPKIFVPMIIGLALIESLVIYAFVIALNLAGKI